MFIEKKAARKPKRYDYHVGKKAKGYIKKAIQRKTKLLTRNNATVV